MGIWVDGKKEKKEGRKREREKKEEWKNGCLEGQKYRKIDRQPGRQMDGEMIPSRTGKTQNVNQESLVSHTVSSPALSRYNL